MPGSWYRGSILGKLIIDREITKKWILDGVALFVQKILKTDNSRLKTYGARKEIQND